MEFRSASQTGVRQDVPGYLPPYIINVRFPDSVSYQTDHPFPGLQIAIFARKACFREPKRTCHMDRPSPEDRHLARACWTGYERGRLFLSKLESRTTFGFALFSFY